jgi:hypothetical protein
MSDYIIYTLGPVALVLSLSWLIFLVFSEFDEKQIKKEWEKRNNETVKNLQSRKMPVFRDLSSREQKRR